MAITHKRGDTFEVIVNFTLNGQPQDLNGWQLRSQIRAANKALLKELDIVVIDEAAGVFSLNCPASETVNWTPAPYQCDIEFIDPSGFVVSSDTFAVNVIRDVTREFTP
jgi:hypothetical protein